MHRDSPHDPHGIFENYPHHDLPPHPLRDDFANNGHTHDHHPTSHQPPTHDRPQPPPYKPRLKTYAAGRRTNPLYWLVAACCAFFWTVIILGAIAVLIVYLAFRPHSPRMDISDVTLNAAYLDTGDLLNADVSLLVNFSNPNRKVDISFSYLQLDLYFNATLIATQVTQPFSAEKGESVLRSGHMVTSEVELTGGKAEAWRQQVAAGRVLMEVRGTFRTRSNLVGFIHYTYWLYGRCVVVVSAPPGGALLATRCRTKR